MSTRIAVGALITGETAVQHLPDGAVVQFLDNPPRTLTSQGRRGEEQRGVVVVCDEYRVLSLPELTSRS